MAEGLFQVPPDSTGAKIRTRSRSIGGNTVHEQAIFPAALPTFYAFVDSVVPAQNKHHLTVWNGHASALLRLKKLFVLNLQTATVTGALTRFDVKKIGT